ncbi:MAG: hypothetical protein ACREM2_05260 [Vulcanimicrobiaceae bacterium]
MNELGATGVLVRRRVARRWLGALCLAALVGALARSPLVAAAIPLCALAFALAEPADAVELFALPLYGRALARVLVVPPITLAAAVAGGLALGALAVGERPYPSLALGLVAAIAIAPIGRSATLRRGRAQALYLALAIAGALAILVVASAGSAGTLGALALSAAIGYAGLRAFAETLARFDPLPER